MGTAVDISEAKPGDLVFYAKGSRINHVGIYIGGGQIINASSPKTGIRISNVYYRTPVAVRRILQD
jgi:cell wall-associated NlpC family hydrolase